MTLTLAKNYPYAEAMGNEFTDNDTMDNNAVYDHKWGYTDTKFEVLPNKSVILTGDRYELSGFEIPGLIPLFEKIFDVTLDITQPKKEIQEKPVTPATIQPEFLDALQKFPTDLITIDDKQRLIHSHGQTTADEIHQVLYNKVEKICDLVFFPQTEQQAIDFIDIANTHNVCVIPYGGGTSVSCALQLPAQETRTIAVINTTGLNEIEWIDETNNKASVQAGITGKKLEELLSEKGYTCGHEPDSIEFSTLGGWIATNASGMKKNRYGNIEQVVENVTFITPTGKLDHLNPQARTSTGIQPQHVAFGSEGNLGLITKATINIYPKPEKTRFNSLVFKDWETGVQYLQELNKTGILPASIRLVDNTQFKTGNALKPVPTLTDKVLNTVQKNFLQKIKNFDPNKMVAATVLMEGTETEVSFQNNHITKLAGKHDGIVGGASNGKRGYLLTYAVAYIRDFLASYGIIGETYETTVPWEKIHQVCEAVQEKAAELHKQYNLPGSPYLSPRVTQLYNTGVCIYFTHGFCTQGVDDPAEVFSKIEKTLRKTILDTGGSLSHHHGVGKLRKEFMNRVLTEGSIHLIESIKKHLDPQNTFGIANNVLAEKQPADAPLSISTNQLSEQS